MQQELSKARSAQQQNKVTLRAEMAKLEHDEFIRLLDVNKRKESSDLQQVRQQRIDNHIHEKTSW